MINYLKKVGKYSLYRAVRFVALFPWADFFVVVAMITGVGLSAVFLAYLFFVQLAEFGW